MHELCKLNTEASCNADTLYRLFKVDKQTGTVSQVMQHTVTKQKVQNCLNDIMSSNSQRNLKICFNVVCKFLSGWAKPPLGVDCLVPVGNKRKISLPRTQRPIARQFGIPTKSIKQPFHLKHDARPTELKTCKQNQNR